MKIVPGNIHGVFKAPASKSDLQRALVIAMLAKGESRLMNCTASADVIAVRSAIETLGAVTEGDDTITVHPASLMIEEDTLIHMGESGLALRMFAPVVSLFSKPVHLNGKGTLINRPLQPLLDVLTEAGVSFSLHHGTLPLKITGHLTKPFIDIDCSFSSQILTGLLIALPLTDHDTVLNVRNLVSKPYTDMTLKIMRDFGVTVESHNYEQFHISGNQKYIGRTYEVEADWSSAASLLVGAAVSGEIRAEGLRIESLQADRKIMDALILSGAHVSIDKNCVYVRKNECRPFNFDATHCPDLFPPLAVLAAAALGTSRIEGVERLLHKESNRLESIREMLITLGCAVDISDNSMVIHGTGKLTGGTVSSHHDHRIVMVAAIASCISENPVQIVGTEAVGKSFPGFFETLTAVMKS